MSTRQVIEPVSAAQRDIDEVLMSTNGTTPLAEAMRRLWATHPSQLGAASLDGIRAPGYEASPPKGAEEDWAYEKVWQQMHSDALEIRKLVDRMHRNVRAWQSKAASPKDRELAGLNAAMPLGCEHCQTVAMWSEVYVKSSDVKGNLQTMMRLCQPCYEFTLRHGQLPSRKQLEDRKAKGSWRETA